MLQFQLNGDCSKTPNVTHRQFNYQSNTWTFHWLFVSIVKIIVNKSKSINKTQQEWAEKQNWLKVISWAVCEFSFRHLLFLFVFTVPINCRPPICVILHIFRTTVWIFFVFLLFVFCLAVSNAVESAHKCVPPNVGQFRCVFAQVRFGNLSKTFEFHSINRNFLKIFCSNWSHHKLTFCSLLFCIILRNGDDNQEFDVWED